MDEKEKFEFNKRHNAPFLRALNVLMKEREINQAQAAKLLQTKSGTFSDYKSGKKKAGAEMYDRLARAFEGRLNMRYLTGQSDYMMLANVPDEEIIEYSMRDGNPDYDIMQKQKLVNTTPVVPSANIPDMSSVFNSALAAKDDAIESLKRELRTKDELIQSLREQISAKEQLIADQKARLIEYRRIIDSQQGIESYPFPIGVAEKSQATK